MDINSKPATSFEIEKIKDLSFGDLTNLLEEIIRLSFLMKTDKIDKNRFDELEMVNRDCTKELAEKVSSKASSALEQMVVYIEIAQSLILTTMAIVDNLNMEAEAEAIMRGDVDER